MHVFGFDLDLHRFLCSWLKVSFLSFKYCTCFWAWFGRNIDKYCKNIAQNLEQTWVFFSALTLVNKAAWCIYFNAKNPSWCSAYLFLLLILENTSTLCVSFSLVLKFTLHDLNKVLNRSSLKPAETLITQTSVL